MGKTSVVITEKDTLATATVNFKKGDKATMFINKDEHEVSLLEDIAFGHKFAIKAMKKGDHVIKYGESLGLATKDIAIGEWAHVHNVESERGRGDKA